MTASPARLTRLAGLAAGPGAVVTAVPGGGFVAESPGVVVDCSLTRLANLAVAALGAGRAGFVDPMSDPSRTTSPPIS